MSPREPAILLGAVLASFVVACSTMQDPAEPPAWIDVLPNEDEHLYAVGNYYGALYREDNRKHAVNSARGMLAENLKSRVRQSSKQTDFGSGGSKTKTETLVDTDYVLKNAEEIASWTDISGRMSTRGTVWVLMRVRRMPD
jgi:hypothetical protein